MATLSNIESAMWRIVKNTVSANVYVSGKPLTLSDSIKDFVIVSAGGNMTEYTDFGNGSNKRGNVTFELFARDRATGEPDSSKLSDMEEKLVEAIGNGVTSNGYFNYRSSYSSPRLDSDWHSKIYVYEIITK